MPGISLYADLIKAHRLNINMSPRCGDASMCLELGYCDLSVLVGKSWWERLSIPTDSSMRGLWEESAGEGGHCGPATVLRSPFRRGSESLSLPARQSELRRDRADDLKRPAPNA